jgi:hypothetical protein
MKLMLLMIVTPPDLPIAPYSVKAIIPALSEQIELVIYFNGVDPGGQKDLRAKIPSNSYIEYRSNWSSIDKNRDQLRREIGTYFKVDASNGNYTSDFRQGIYEACSEVWSRELLNSGDNELVGTIDADFECLDTSWLKSIDSLFEKDTMLAFASVDYSPQSYGYESYSRTNAYLAERYHTWFCVYRRSALDLDNSFFYTEEAYKDSILKFDHSAKLQSNLKDLYGFHGAKITEAMRWMFLHYGAFAKNRSLVGWKLKIYRFLRLLKHNGYYHLHQNKPFSYFLRMCGIAGYKFFGMRRYDAQRRHYIFEQ